MRRIETPCLQYLNVPAREQGSLQYHFKSFGTPDDPVLHRYAYDTIFLVRSGKGIVLSQGTRITTEGPCLIFFKKERPYAEFFESTVHFEKYTLRTRSVSHPRVQEIYQEINLNLKESPIVVPLSEERVDWLFQTCNHLINLLYNRRIPHTDERTLIPFCYLLEEILYTLKKRVQPAKIYYSPHIEKILRHIDEHLTERMTLQELSAYVNIGKTKLCKDFKKEVAVPVHQYIMNARLELAKQYLNQGHTVGEAAALSGFSDCAHFTRLFKKRFRRPPSRYLPNRKIDVNA